MSRLLPLVLAALLAACQQVPGELDRQTGVTLSAFSRPGRMAGELKWVHNMAIDSKGNLYTAEVGTGRRAQKFTRVE